MPRVYKPTSKLYTEASIFCALDEVRRGAAIKTTAKKYFMSPTMLTQRLKKAETNLPVGKQGRGTWLSSEIENKLAMYLRRMSEMGMGPTKGEVIAIVSEYLIANEMNVPFTDSAPGKDWAFKFMQRHSLVLKKAITMQIARKNVTSDPFVIYGFYDILEAEVQRLGIADRPECVWNLDESGFPMDPSRCKTVHAVGKPAIQVTCGANRDNTTVLACCSADGTAMDPLVIFKGKGKHIMSNWKGDGSLPKMTYGISESGWMTTDIFHEWFEHFCKETKDIRPLLLLYDGHLSHTSLQTIELAVNEGISILKLPAHCTDVLQPLDVACFSPLKSYYEKQLTERVFVTGAREPLRKGEFCNVLGKIWRRGLSVSNIMAGFAATGVFPVNRDKYKIARLDKVKLASYNRWVEQGRPKDDEGLPIVPCEQPPLVVRQDSTNSTDCIPSTSTAPEAMPTNQPSPLPVSLPSTSIQAGPSPSTASFSPNTASQVKSLIKQLQSLAPEGMRYVVTLEQKESETSFEAIMKSRGRPSQSAPPAKRSRISMHAKIITHNDFAQAVEERNKEKTQPKKRTTKRRLQLEHESESETDADNPDECNEARPSTSDSELNDSDVDTLSASVCMSMTHEDLAATLPLANNVKKDEYYAVYWDRTHYWGKVLELFREDEGLPPNKIEISFLCRKLLSSSPELVRWAWPSREDKAIISVESLLIGPAQPIVDTEIKGKTWSYFKEEKEAVGTYNVVKRYGFPSPKKRAMVTGI